MKKLDRILIANDSLEGLEAALNKAALLEHYTGAEIEVAESIWDSVEDEPLPEAQKANLIAAFVAAEKHALEDMLEPLKERVAWTDARVLWNKRADEAILHEAEARHIDLLIKPARKERSITDQFYAPLDWRLIRESSCAVLVSKSNEWQTGGNVLAALDVADPKHAALNDTILDTAALLAKVLDARLHLVSTYSELGRWVSESQATIDYEQLRRDLHDARVNAMNDALANHELTARLDSPEVHAREGKAAGIIPELASELNAVVTVMGTHARSGVGKWVLGNTIEQALPKFTTDVVTVRNTTS